MFSVRMRIFGRSRFLIANKAERNFRRTISFHSVQNCRSFVLREKLHNRHIKRFIFDFLLFKIIRSTFTIIDIERPECVSYSNLHIDSIYHFIDTEIYEREAEDIKKYIVY